MTTDLAYSKEKSLFHAWEMAKFAVSLLCGSLLEGAAMFGCGSIGTPHFNFERQFRSNNAIVCKVKSILKSIVVNIMFYCFMIINFFKDFLQGRR